MKTKANFDEILEDVKFRDWNISVQHDAFADGGYYLQIKVDGICNVTEKPFAWSSRKWRLSSYMTRSEVVQTALKAVLTATEHEVREQFTYRGQTIFDPHYDVDKLVALRSGTDALDTRTASVAAS